VQLDALGQVALGDLLQYFAYLRRFAADLPDQVMADGVADQDGQQRYRNDAAGQQLACLGLFLQALFDVGREQGKRRIAGAELLVDGAGGAAM